RPSPRRGGSSGAVAFLDRDRRRGLPADSGLRVGAAPSLRPDGLEQRVRRPVLHYHRFSRGARFRRARLAPRRLGESAPRRIHARAPRRPANLRHVLDLRGGALAVAVRAGVSLLTRLVDTPKAIRYV